jgi:thiol:disulfide interchange protein DsbD
MKQKLYLFLGIFLMLSAAFAGPSDQYSAQKEEILQARLIQPTQELVRQNSSELLVEIQIKDNWHINSNKPLEDYLIATKITFDKVPGISFGKVQYMDPTLRKFSFSEKKLSVFEKTVYALTTITISPEFDQDELKISGNIYFQACNDQSCLAPQQYYFAALTPVAASGTVPGQINQNLFKTVLPKFKERADAGSGNEFSDIIQKSGLFYAFIFIYLGGLALNLTPCVYPLIPITISYFGGQSGGSRQALIFRAVLYVLGMSITYSILGILASLTGGLFGSALQNPLVLIFVALVLIGLALSMFGLYEIRVPQSLALLGGKNRAGYIGTLFMGLTVGLIAAPCIGPFVLGLLTYVSGIGDPFLGFWMFFVLALGLGTPFLFLGIFSGAIAHLPRSGAWMVWVRNLFGFILIGMAVYFLEPLLPGDIFYFMTLGVLAIVAGIYLGWLDKNTGRKGFNITRKVVASLLIILGIFFVLPKESAAGHHINWQTYTPASLQKAKEQQKLIIIDFYADWCIPCKELEKFTFSDPRIIDQSQEFVAFKADLTHYQAEETNKLRKEYQIKGVPTIVFIGKDGNELTKLRLTEFVNADQFLETMQAVFK